MPAPGVHVTSRFCQAPAASCRWTMVEPTEPRAPTVHIDLRVDFEHEELRGCATWPGRPGVEFRGWLGMLAALARLLEAPSPAADEDF